jgi:hypothetical protein
MLTYFMLLPGLYFVFTDVDSLHVQTEPAVAVLPVQTAGRNLVHLPDIEFRLGVSTYCARSGRPESLSITVADTQRTLRTEELQASKTVDVAMRVPANQIAPLALREFCIDTASAGESVLITTALALQASLRCSRGDDQSIVFAAEALDIRVVCIGPTAAATEPVDD